MDSRGKTILADILPVDKEAYVNLLQQRRDWQKIHEYRWYPTVSMSRKDSNKLMDIEVRNKHSLLINDIVLRSWNENGSITSNEPFDPILTLPRSISWYQEETTTDEEKLAKCLDKILTRQSGRTSKYIIVVPIMTSNASQGLYCRGFTVFDSEVGMVLDVFNKNAMTVFRERIIENPNIIKFVLDASIDVYLFHVFAKSSPANVRCLTAAARFILLKFKVPEPSDNNTGHDKLFPFLRYWNVSTIAEVNVSCVYQTVICPDFLRTSKGYVLLLAMLLKGADLIHADDGTTWTEIFKYDKLPTIVRLDNFLTTSLGLNFWTSINYAIKSGLNLKLFIIAFLFENYCCNFKLSFGDSKYLDAIPMYHRLRNLMITQTSKDYEYLLDTPCQDELGFGILTVNVLKYNHVVDVTDKIGTLGEILRRVDRFIPSIMNL